MIEVKGLKKSYGRMAALRGISFSVREGEVAGFVGLNGAGKTTTMRVICGYLPFDEGRVRVGSHDVVKESIRARSLIGYLPEGVPHYPDMRVLEFLRYRAAIKGLGGARRRGALDRVLTSCGLTEVRRRIIGQLSKGYRQRVGVAEALLVDPPYLILDEPTVGLDPLQVRHLRELLKTIGRERTIITSTHILSEVEVVCDSVIVIHRGMILARGGIDEIMQRVGSATGREPATLEDAFVALVRQADQEDAA
jgi:ABC-2 type transport system ATP-binding protein